MLNIRSITLINGIVALALSLAMTVPFMFDHIVGTGKCSTAFLSSIIISIFFGGLMVFSSLSSGRETVSKRDAFLLVASLWTTTSIICALPFYIHGEIPFVSALFESVSGITTTGCSIYSNVEDLPRAIQLWRFILHFIGGAGIVAIGIFLLPIMRVGGMQLFLTENSDKTQKIFPRAIQTVSVFVAIYVLFILIFMVLFKMSGMSLFDAACHSISSISTGGFSTRNAGIGAFGSSSIKVIASFAMFFGSITFMEYVKALKYGARSFFTNQQTLGYFKLLALLLIIPLFIKSLSGTHINWKLALDHCFQVLSAITTTNIRTLNGCFSSHIVLIIAAIIGGCSGSTAGGLKIFRIQILYAILKHHLKRLIRTYDVSIPKYQSRKIDLTMTFSVISFLFATIVVFILSVAILEIISKRETMDCIKATSSALFNLGFDFDQSSLDEHSKLILLIDMILGRLEIIPILMLMSKTFWTKE